MPTLCVRPWASTGDLVPAARVVSAVAGVVREVPRAHGQSPRGDAELSWGCVRARAHRAGREAATVPQHPSRQAACRVCTRRPRVVRRTAWEGEPRSSRGPAACGLRAQLWTGPFQGRSVSRPEPGTVVV